VRSLISAGLCTVTCTSLPFLGLALGASLGQRAAEGIFLAGKVHHRQRGLLAKNMARHFTGDFALSHDDVIRAELFEVRDLGLRVGAGVNVIPGQPSPLRGNIRPSAAKAAAPSQSASTPAHAAAGPALGKNAMTVLQSGVFLCRTAAYNFVRIDPSTCQRQARNADPGG